MATNAALRGMRRAEAQAAEAAFSIVRSGTAAPVPLSQAQMQALEAGPDMLKGLTELHQAKLAYKANAEVLRGADAMAAALLRWSV
jgi:hypothetical protein